MSSLAAVRGKVETTGQAGATYIVEPEQRLRAPVRIVVVEGIVVVRCECLTNLLKVWIERHRRSSIPRRFNQSCVRNCCSPLKCTLVTFFMRRTALSEKWTHSTRSARVRNARYTPFLRQEKCKWKFLARRNFELDCGRQKKDIRT